MIERAGKIGIQITPPRKLAKQKPMLDFDYEQIMPIQDVIASIKPNTDKAQERLEKLGLEL